MTDNEGSDGQDKLTGEDGNDTLLGDKGNDFLDGSASDGSFYPTADRSEHLERRACRRLSVGNCSQLALKCYET